MPALDTLPLIQCHHVWGLAACGGALLLAGALCDLLASLGMENDARFGGFYEEIR